MESIANIANAMMKVRLSGLLSPTRKWVSTTNVLKKTSSAPPPDKPTEKKKKRGDAYAETLLHSSAARIGMQYIRDPRLNKSLAFTLKERQLLGIHGLLPPSFLSMEKQVDIVIKNVNRYEDPLNAYIYLMSLLERNEHLFYRAVTEHVEQLMPIIYTPTVGIACQKYGLISRIPRGLFITIHDKGNIRRVLRNWPEPTVRAIVVTDGGRILGLGDLGANGMGIAVGKLALYTALAGVKPYETLPITLDVGTNNKSLMNDPFYNGLRLPRTKGPEYMEFLDEFMGAVVDRYGKQCLIQFEDFQSHIAFELLNRYKDDYCTFNDDIQGTSSVVTSGLLTSLRITKVKLTDNVFYFLGAGQAALGIAILLSEAMSMEGISIEEARSKIWMMDADGLLTKNRKDLDPAQQLFAKDCEQFKDLRKAVNHVKPTAILGAAAAAGAFTEDILKDLASFNERPIVFALSNPTSKAECTAEQAYTATDGRCVFSSGSPFRPVTYKGKTFIPGQGNNAYIFPGVALAVVSCEVHHVQDAFFLMASKALSEMVSEEDLAVGRVFPPLTNIRECSVTIATKVATYAYDKGLANHYPRPADLEAYIRGEMYDYNYPAMVPGTYDWPAEFSTLK